MDILAASNTSMLTIYIISDSLGETGEHLVKAALSQFDGEDFELKKIPYVLNQEYLESILDEASQNHNTVLFYTLVEKDLIEYLEIVHEMIDIAEEIKKDNQ